MCRSVLGKTDGTAIFRSQFRICNRNGPIDSGVTGRIRSIVRKRAQSKGILVSILAFTNQLADKISAANIMCQVAELLVAKRIVTKILNNGSAIGIGMSFPNLVFSESWKALQQKGPNF